MGEEREECFMGVYFGLCVYYRVLAALVPHPPSRMK